MGGDTPGVLASDQVDWEERRKSGKRLRRYSGHPALGTSGLDGRSEGLFVD